MLKIFFFGILLGIAAAAGALYAIPVVDQYRDASIISVAQNGGNVEIFHINMPTDRIMAAGSERASVPDELTWPGEAILGSASAEIFKIRNARDAVVGVAARTVGTEGDTDIIDWVIHLPSRGSLYVIMDANAVEDDYRLGTIRAGSRELKAMVGVVSERWIEDASDDEDAPNARIELSATYGRRPELAE